MHVQHQLLAGPQQTIDRFSPSTVADTRHSPIADSATVNRSVGDAVTEAGVTAGAGASTRAVVAVGAGFASDADDAARRPTVVK